MIVPPPEIKTIIDKLAKRIGAQTIEQGDQFVTLILQNDPKNPKFNFLKNLDDPYRPYYDAQLAEARSIKLVGDEQAEVSVEAALVKEMPKKE